MRSLKQLEWPLVILGMAVILGAIVRFMPVIMAGFPLNDGGMFHVMIADLIANGFRLPLFTTYNLADIPYAYPPFGFYVAALFKVLLRVPQLESLRWLPSLANLVSIYAVYLLASALLNDRPRAAVAAAFYALAPGSYGWFIMGGGLTRALGGLFLVLSVYFLHRVFQRGTRGEIIAAILFCALSVLSHPEAGLHAAASCALVWIFWGRTRRGLAHAALIAAGAVLLTSPWWLSLLARHGTDPFISVFHTGMYGSPILTALAADFFSRNSIIPILTVLRMAGLVWALWKRQYFLTAWMLLPYFVEPRSASAVSCYPFSMLAALGLADVFPALARLLQRKPAGTSTPPAFTEIKWMNLSVLTILFYLFIESAFFAFPLVNMTLRPRAAEIMAWIRDNTPQDSRFLIITGDPGAMEDPMQEWFPALAERRSQTTLQGLEWTLAEGFVPRLNHLSELQTCQSAQCIEDWSAGTGLDFTHLLIMKEGAPEGLAASLAESGYEISHETPKFAVFQR